MAWTILFHPEFEREFAGLPENVRVDLLATLRVVELFGPSTGRPAVDTLKGSRHTNMKELRIRTGGAWRFAFAFDPKRAAVVLCGGNKAGGSEALSIGA